MPTWWLRALAVLLVLLLLATGVVTAVVTDGRDRLAGALTNPLTTTRTDADLTARHRAVASAAEELVRAFLSVDHRDMEPLVETVLAGATGGFAREYGAERDRLVEQAQRTRAVSAAEVVAVGVDELEGDSATVLVAADTVVRNRSTGDRAEARYYRLRLDLVLEDGRWLTEDVEFVR